MSVLPLVHFEVDSQRRVDAMLKFYSLRLKPFQHAIVHVPIDASFLLEHPPLCAPEKRFVLAS